MPKHFVSGRTRKGPGFIPASRYSGPNPPVFQTTSQSPLRSAQHRRVFWLYALLLLSIIGMANSGRGAAILGLVAYVPGTDFTGHLLLVGTFSYWLNRAFVSRMYGLWRLRFSAVSLIFLVVITLEETSQLWLENRSFSYSDMLGNALGIFMFTQLAYLKNRRECIPY